MKLWPRRASATAEPRTPEDFARRCVAAVVAGDAPGAVAAARAVPTEHRAAAGELLERAAWAVRMEKPHPIVPAGAVPAASGLSLAGAALQDRAADAAARAVWLTRYEGDETDPFLDMEVWADAVVGKPKAWRTRLVRALLSGEERNAELRWRWVDALVRRGAVDTPDLTTDVVWVLRQPWDSLASVAAEMPRVAGLLERVLSTPGVGREIKYADVRGGWEPLLTALGARTPEGRARVLDDVLAGLLGALPETDSEGLVLLAQALEPTDAELAARQAGVLDLLLARRAPVAALAREWTGRLVLARTVDGDALLAVTPDVLALPRKNAVVGHVRLLGEAARAGLVDRSATAHAVAGSLDPNRPDLAVKLATLVGTLASGLDDDDVASLRTLVADLVPAPWADLQRALGVVAAGQDDTARANGTVLSQGSAEPERRAQPSSGPGAGRDVEAASAPAPRPAPVDLPEPGRVAPVADLDEMVDLAARVLTDGNLDPLEVERALDGMARLRGLPRGVAASFLARDERAGFSAPVVEVAAVVRAWAGLPYEMPHGQVMRAGRVDRPEDAPTGPTVRVQPMEEREPVLGPDGVALRGEDNRVRLRPVRRWHWQMWIDAWAPVHLVRRRMAGACLLVTGAPGPTVSAPTRADGSVDLDTFLARITERAQAGLPFWGDDVGTALLRLSAADRAELLRREIPDGTRAALEVLDAPQEWARQVVQLRRWGNPVEHRELWGAARPQDGGPDDPVRSWLDTRTVLDDWADTALSSGMQVGHPRFPTWWALVLPGRPDLLSVHLQPALMGWVDDASADLSGPLAALGGSRVPLGAPSAAALVWAGAAKSVRTRAAAAEAIAGAARTGMLDGEVLGRELATLIGPDSAGRPAERAWPPVVPTVSRVAGTLADAARIDEHGEVVVLDALVAALGVLRDVRQGALLLEVAANLATSRRVQVNLPPALAELAAGRGSTRMAQEARRLAGAGR